jgi:hypothetical protein
MPSAPRISKASQQKEPRQSRDKKCRVLNSVTNTLVPDNKTPKGADLKKSSLKNKKRERERKRKRKRGRKEKDRTEKFLPSSNETRLFLSQPKIKNNIISFFCFSLLIHERERKTAPTGNFQQINKVPFSPPKNSAALRDKLYSTTHTPLYARQKRHET